MKKLFCGLFIFYLFSLVSCHNAQDQLVGKWQATKLSENGDSLAIDPSLIRFQFTTEGQYIFESTLNYTEAGNYRLEGPLLYTLDTIQATQSEKAVIIDWISLDTMQMQMKDNDNNRELVLVRQY